MGVTGELLAKGQRDQRLLASAPGEWQEGVEEDGGEDEHRVHGDRILLDPRRMYQTALGPGRYGTVSGRVTVRPLHGGLLLNPGCETSVISSRTSKEDT